MTDANQFADVPTEALAERAAGLAPDSEDRWRIVTEFHRRGSEDIFELGVAWLSDDRANCRSLGADVLAQLGHHDASYSTSPYGDKSKPLLIEALGDSEAVVLQSAIVALGHLANWGIAWDSTLLAPHAAHADDDVRHAVAFALGGTRCDTSEEAVRIMIGLTGDRAAYVRDWATFGLGVQSDANTPAIRDALLARLEDDDLDTRGEAIVSLTRRSEPRAVEAVILALQSAELQTSALEGISESPQPAFVPALEQLLRDSDGDPFISEVLEACRATPQ